MCADLRCVAKDFQAAWNADFGVESERTRDEATGVLCERAERYSAAPPLEGWAGLFVAKDK